MSDNNKIPTEEEEIDFVDVSDIEKEKVIEEEEEVDPEVLEKEELEKTILSLLKEEKTAELIEIVWQLQKNLQEEKKKSNEYLNTAQMVQANFENYQKRIRKEQEYSNYRNKSTILQKFLTLYEDLERTVQQLETKPDLKLTTEAIKLIFKNFKSNFDNLGIEIISPLNDIFDPKFHEVVYTIENEDAPDNQIVEVLSKGFVIENNVLKPAKVVISKHPQKEDN